MLKWSLVHFLSRGISRGIIDWELFTSARRNLEKWFRHGVIEFGGQKSKGCLASRLNLAALTGADGMVFVERVLSGLLSTETSDGFWSLSPYVYVPESLPGPADLEYLARYQHMSRIDIYHITPSGTILTGGIPTTFERDIDALRKCLSTPRTMRIESDGESIPCTFSIASEKRFEVRTLLVVDIRRDGAHRLAQDVKDVTDPSRSIFGGPALSA